MGQQGSTEAGEAVDNFTGGNQAGSARSSSLRESDRPNTAGPQSVSKNYPPSSLRAEVLSLVDDTNMENEAQVSPGISRVQSNSLLRSPLTETDTVPVVFRYLLPPDEPFDAVYITGSFNDWHVKIILEYEHQYEGDRQCSVVLDLAPGTYYFRYIFQDKWIHGSDEDADFEIVDNVKYYTVSVKQPVFEPVFAPYVESDDDMGDMLRESKAHTGYGQHIPRPAEYIKDCPRLPPFLSQQILNADTGASVDPYALPVPSHVVLNHVFACQKDRKEEAGDVRVVSLTQRYKTKAFAKSSAKFITTVFYAPKFIQTAEAAV